MTDLLEGREPVDPGPRARHGAPRPGPSRPGAGPEEGRPAARERRWGDVAIAATLGLVAVVTRLPLQSDYLVNFDSVNFAFAVEGFDLAHHEPHPPGYLGYVLLARAVDLVVGDVNRSLTLISVLAAGVMAVTVHLLLRRVASRWSAVAATVLFLAAPLTWYYGIVGLSYLPGAALATVLVLACHRARFDRSAAALVVAAVALAALGALRQTDIVLFAPLVGYAALAFPNRMRWRVGALVAVLSVPWLVPLLMLSGGPAEYVEQSRDLAVLAGERTSVFGLDPGGLLRNVRLVGTGLVAGVFAALPLVWHGVRRRLLSGSELRFVAVWLVPSLIVFLFVHTGQLGYVLPLVPAAYWIAARAIDRWRGEPAPPGRSSTRSASQGSPRRRVVAVAVVALVAVDVLAFAVVPSAVVDASRDDRAELPLGATLPLPDVLEIRPLDVAANDAHWEMLIERAQASDPDRSVIVAKPNTSVSFRHLAFYLRSHTVYAIGHGTDRRFGHLFTARGGETDYSVDGLRSPNRTLQLAPGVRSVVVFDVSPGGLETDLPAHWDRLDDGTPVLTLHVPEGSTLRLRGGRGEDPSITLAERP